MKDPKKKYHKRDCEVEAMRYDGQYAFDIAHDLDTHFSGYFCVDGIYFGECKTKAVKGDYVVRTSKGKIKVYPPEKFAEKYMEAKEDETGRICPICAASCYLENRRVALGLTCNNCGYRSPDATTKKEALELHDAVYEIYSTKYYNERYSHDNDK